MIIVKVELDDAKAQAAFAELEKRAVDLGPLMRTISTLMQFAVEENFRQEGRPAWSPLSPVTLARRRRTDTPGHRPPCRFRRTQSRFAYCASRHQCRVWPVMQFGAGKGAFGKTRRGAPIPWGDIPSRPFLSLGPDDLSDIGDAIADYLKSAV